MATIPVNSSPERNSAEFNKSHPGTTENDIFIISKSSHGFPSVNGPEGRKGGSDTYHLNLDVLPDTKKPHSLGLGGGSPNIYGYNFNKDRIVLPEGVALRDIIIIGAVEKKEGTANIRYDPHGIYKKIFPANDSYFEMIWMKGSVYISG